MTVAHELDAVLQQEYPLHVVGIHVPFEPLLAPGSRLLLTADGLMLEACNGVFHSIEPLAAMKTCLALPFGAVTPGITMIDEPAANALRELVTTFTERARRASPNETIMLVVKAPGQPLRCIHPEKAAGPANLLYDLDELQEDEHVILDIHSHGTTAAGFSSVDDRDDWLFRGHLKLSYVIGGMNQSCITYTHRWVSRGHVFRTQDELRTAPASGAHTC